MICPVEASGYAAGIQSFSSASVVAGITGAGTRASTSSKASSAICSK